MVVFFQDFHDTAANLWATSRQVNGVQRHCPRWDAVMSTKCSQSQISQTEYRDGTKEIYQESFDPPRKLIVNLNPPKVIKTFYAKPRRNDTRKLPRGPFDILQAERLLRFSSTRGPNDEILGTPPGWWSRQPQQNFANEWMKSDVE